MNPEQGNPEEARKLESWKEIAAYLQRDVKTAHRWEKSEGLPVHRHSHRNRASVYAYPSEIDTWKQSRRVAPDPAPVRARPLWRVPSFALAILLCLMMVGNGIRPQAVSAGQGKALTKRLLCANCFASDSTPDGRTMLLIDPESGDLGIRNMSTGRVSLLGVVRNSQTDEVEGALLSPDHKQIAITFGEGETRSECRVMPNQRGAASRVVSGDAVVGPSNSCDVEAWFPDGKSLLAMVSPSQLVRISLSDGAITVLKSQSLRPPTGQMRLSPDGRFLAYSAGVVNPAIAPLTSGDPRDMHIYVLATDGSSESEIVKSSGVNDNPVWTPDGRHILFTSNRSGKTDLWSIPMLNGKAADAESMVSPDIGPTFVPGIYNGSLYYTHFTRGEYIRIVDVATGAALADSLLGARPAWSPDGKSVAFKRRQPNQPNRYNLVIRTLETGAERNLTSGDTSGSGQPLWTHDGKSIITGVQRSGAKNAPYRIDVASGALTELPGVTSWDALSPDDKTVYGVRRDPDGKTPARVLAYDLTSSKEHQVFESTSAAAPSIALSPDGRTLALGWRDVGARSDAKLHIARVNVDGSRYREVSTLDHQSGGGRLAWSKDGQSIFFNQEPLEAGPIHRSVMRVPAEGGPAVLAFKAAGELQNLDLSSDGSRFVYSANETSNELWALDNVLAALK